MFRKNREDNDSLNPEERKALDEMLQNVPEEFREGAEKAFRGTVAAEPGQEAIMLAFSLLATSFASCNHSEVIRLISLASSSLVSGPTRAQAKFP